MPWRARLSFPGIPWHIIQRGNNRSACFYAEEDYRFYLERLTELAQKFGCAVRPLRADDQPVHLLLTPE
jgi:putative transposase